MVDVAAERGAGDATVAHVVARSGVSRRTFYELFADREECFLAAFDDTVERIAAVVLPAYRRPVKWRERVRGGLMTLLEFLTFERGAGRLVIVETLGAGPKALERRRRVLAQIITAVDEGRGEGRGGEGPPPLTAEGVVGGVFSLIHARLVDGRDAALIELLNPLMGLIVLPYLGPAAARRELAQPTPPAHDGDRRVATDPLRDLEMRLTYRTIRVLLAIGALSERGSDHRDSYPSNRQVGDAAGIHDQGQISKLLARLKHLGLIENAGHSQAKGEPNKWTLTQRGDEVQKTISAQTSQL